MIRKIDHIGIAVRSIAEAVRFYEEALGIACEKVEEVLSQKVRVAFFPIGDIRIELLEPLNDDSPIAKFLEKSGEGVHHIAYQTNDIDSQLQRARLAGIKLIHEHPVQGANGKLVAFLHPKWTGGVLTEICSTEKS